MMSGHTIPIEMDSSATILDVKKDLQAKEGVDQAVIKLLFRDQEVTDAQTIGEVSKLAGSNFYSLQAHEKVHLDTTMMKGNVVPIDMETTNTVLDVKKKLQETENCDPWVIALYLNGGEIYDDVSLETVKNKANSNTIPLECKERMHLDVVMMSGQNVPLEMETKQVITDVKKKLEEAEGIDWHLLNLLFRDDMCADEMTLEDLKNKANSNTVELIAKEKISLIIKLMSGKDVPMEMVSADTILDVKKKLNDTEGIDFHKIILLLNDKGLQDEDPLREVKVMAGSNTITLIEKEKVAISVKMMAGNI